MEDRGGAGKRTVGRRSRSPPAPGDVEHPADVGRPGLPVPGVEVEPHEQHPAELLHTLRRAPRRQLLVPGGATVSGRFWSFRADGWAEPRQTASAQAHVI